MLEERFKVKIMKYPIKYSTNPPSKIFEVNDLEEQFFNTLYLKLSNDINEKIYLLRLSDGTLNVEYKNGLYMGKIKLQGRKHSMQILKSLYKSYTVYDDFNEHISEWINYFDKYLRKEM
jgi:hypothetical protein